MNNIKNDVMSVAQRYSYDIDINAGTAAAQVIRLTGQNKRVLELGPGPGTILRFLAQHNQCEVNAVEFDPECVKLLQQVCHTVVEGDLDRSDWLTTFEGQQFDVIIAADVLEHLKNPWQCLSNVRSLLAPNGYLIVSIPNVGHNSVLASLISGRFPYQHRGLLDKTHLRFFTRQDFGKTLFEAGFLPSHWYAVQMSAAQAELGHHWLNLDPAQQAALNSNPYGEDYQYVVKAFSSNEAGTVARSELLQDELQAINTRQAEELTDAHKKIAQLLATYEQQENHYSDQLAQAIKQVGDYRKLQENLAQLEQLQNLTSDQNVELRRKIEDIWTSTSWRYTAPFRGMKKILTGTSKHSFRDYLRSFYRILPSGVRALLDRSGISSTVRGIAQDMPASNRLTLRPGSIGNAHALKIIENPFSQNSATQDASPTEDVFFWGVIDWNFRFQRPQQLALGFAKRGHRVFYISSELVNDKEPGFQVEAIPNHSNIYQIRFHAESAPSIYESKAIGKLLHQLLQGLAYLVQSANTNDSISIVQHPFWLPLARSLPTNHMAYDCMDHHEGFGNVPPEVISAERALMRESDTLIVTSDWLYNIAEHKNRNVSVVRNACEFSHFSPFPAVRFQDSKARKIIGYFGAIANWFDCALIAKLSVELPDCLILLIGNDTCGAQEQFSSFKNIKMVGEVSYEKLPYYLHAFDVCILPFQISDLTLATNPVKVYEYLCSGKPIVSVDLPELHGMSELVHLAKDHQQFADKCKEALQETIDAPVRKERVEFASKQTWAHRAQEFELALEKSKAAFVSIVVVTYNNLDLTKLCLASIDSYTTGVRYEIIVVDNASADETPKYLEDFAKNRKDVKLILNQDNLGFSKANNQGLNLATGDYLVVLNNDTVVTRGWASGLIRHCRKDPTIGLIGPVTNNIGNEAKINIEYQSLDEMPGKAREYTLAHLGESFDIHTLAFFCVMITRGAYEKIGGLDEAFGLGFFEDDDYCRRIEQAGLRLVCADDVFVHHNLSASFNKLGEERKRELFLRNKTIYEAKWGQWIPHNYRV